MPSSSQAFTGGPWLLAGAPLIEGAVAREAEELVIGNSGALALPIARAEELAQANLEALMEQYVLGSTSAFDEIYRRTSGRIFGYLMRLTGHRERAEDLLQITYSKLHRARDSYLLGAPLMPWVFAIARRSFLDERRHAKSRSEELSRDGQLPEPEPAPRELLPTDTVAALEHAMSRLPENYREAIELTKVSGLSIAEAAEVLGTSQAAVKLRIHRGYLQLRKALAEFSRTAP